MKSIYYYLYAVFAILLVGSFLASFIFVAISSIVTRRKQRKQGLVLKEFNSGAPREDVQRKYNLAVTERGWSWRIGPLEIKWHTMLTRRNLDKEREKRERRMSRFLNSK